MHTLSDDDGDIALEELFETAANLDVTLETENSVQQQELYEGTKADSMHVESNSSLSCSTIEEEHTESIEAEQTTNTEDQKSSSSEEDEDDSNDDDSEETEKVKMTKAAAPVPDTTPVAATPVSDTTPEVAMAAAKKTAKKEQRKGQMKETFAAIKANRVEKKEAKKAAKAAAKEVQKVKDLKTAAIAAAFTVSARASAPVSAPRSYQPTTAPAAPPMYFGNRTLLYDTDDEETGTGEDAKPLPWFTPISYSTGKYKKTDDDMSVVSDDVSVGFEKTPVIKANHHLPYTINPKYYPPTSRSRGLQLKHWILIIIGLLLLVVAGILLGIYLTAAKPTRSVVAPSDETLQPPNDFEFITPSTPSPTKGSTGSTVVTGPTEPVNGKTPPIEEKPPAPETVFPILTKPPTEAPIAPPTEAPVPVTQPPIPVTQPPVPVTQPPAEVVPPIVGTERPVAGTDSPITTEPPIMTEPPTSADTTVSTIPSISWDSTEILNGQEAGDSFGLEIAMTRDGNFMAAPSGDSVRAFSRMGESWVPLPDIPLANAANDREGLRVATALTPDGDLVVASAHSEQIEVYQFVSGAWMQRGELLEWDVPRGVSAISMDLSKDALTMALGYVDAWGTTIGASIYHYDDDMMSWGSPIDVDPMAHRDSTRRSVRPEEGTILDINVELSGDGKVLSIAEWDIGSPQVILQTFGRNGNFFLWSPLGEPMFFPFGPVSLALSDSGDVLAVVPMAPGRSSTFLWSGKRWEAMGSNADRDFLPGGSSVAMDAQGVWLMIGDAASDTATVYELSDEITYYDPKFWTSWKPMATLSGPIGSGFGTDVSMNADAVFLSVGAPSAGNAGQVTLYESNE